MSPAAAEAVGSNLLLEVDHCNIWFEEAPAVVMFNAVPVPIAVYNSSKLSLILSPPIRRLSPVPSFAELPNPTVCFAISLFLLF